ncbi:hypothetical protein [Streptomyces sp. NPDC003710]
MVDHESAWHGDTASRAALTTVQHHLHAYALGFVRLARVYAPQTLLGGADRLP